MWLDFETTGLNTDTAHLLEMAVGFTITEQDEGGKYLNILEETSFVIHQSQEMLDRADAWVKENHKKLIEISVSGECVIHDYAQLDEYLASRMRHYGSTEKKPSLLLAGNSVWFDRAFLRRFCPLAYALLHYRQIDVSSIQTFYEKSLNEAAVEAVNFPKRRAHRALADLRESISQYHHYQRYAQTQGENK